jgi:hypothetical protein
MARVIQTLNEGAKKSATHISVFILKVASAFMVALTVTLIFQEMIGFSTFSFVLICMTFLLGLIKMMNPWGISAVLVFDLICILTALLLRMYILVAPGG